MLYWLIGLAAAGPSEDLLRSAFKHDGLPSMAHTRKTLTNWDVEHYDIDVHLMPDTQTVDGIVTTTARARVNNPRLMRLTANGPVISSVSVNGIETAWEETLPHVIITIPMNLSEGDRAEVAVSYHVPSPEGPTFLGVNWGDPIHTFHEPRGARKWLVLYDDPSDKALLNWKIRVPSSMSVIANGTPTETLAHDDDTTTHHFEFLDPIPTYLMVLHAGTYDHHLHADGPVDIHTWAQPEIFAQAVSDFSNTGDMMVHFSDLWGAYPWTHYANVTAPFSGAMEHTTATTFGMDLIGTDMAEFVNAHELAHHWFGNLATPSEWPEIWLNEGFASYAEVLWAEHHYGEDAAIDYRLKQRESYVAWQDIEPISPLYDPLFMWGGLVYDKGSLVVHMLRTVMGDDAFFTALADYLNAHRHGNVSTGDLQLAAEAAHGESLAWFFEQWVYQQGDPEYRWGLTQTQMDDGSWQVDIHIDQTGDGHWSMPIEFLLEGENTLQWYETASSTSDTTVTTLCLDEPVILAVFDPRAQLVYGSATQDDDAYSTDELHCGTVGEEDQTPDTEQPDTGSTPQPTMPTTSDQTKSCGCATRTGSHPWMLTLLMMVMALRRDR